MLSQIAASCSALAVAVQLCPLPESPHVLFCDLGWGWVGFLPLPGKNWFLFADVD